MDAELKQGNRMGGLNNRGTEKDVEGDREIKEDIL
jgi:hypothetical protein